MAAGLDELKTVLLESLKMQAQTRFAVKLMLVRLELIEARIDASNPLPEESNTAWNGMREHLDVALKDLDERFSELLSAMERYSND
ncbi:MAG: hypothetical protein RL244_1395 [Pseudomonadota bacterium]|jgi:hypothetical protein